jgi:hypothetical protein
MKCVLSLQHLDRGFESHLRHGCLCAFILCLCCSVYRYRLCDRLIPRPRSPTDCVTCERCLQEDESATHILCDCEAIAYLRFCHLGQFFMEPSDFYDAPIFKSPTFHSECRINKGLSYRGSTIDRWRSRCRGRFLWPTPYIHTYRLCNKIKKLKKRPRSKEGL